MSSFQLVALDPEPFTPLFKLSDAQLREQGVERCVATTSPGYPCRVGLDDAQVGDELLLLPYQHQAAASPYRASGPVFIRRHATRRLLAPGEIPSSVALRLISVRAYDATHRMIDAAVCEGAVVHTEIERQFDNAEVAYLHLHNAKQGCFSCRVDRVLAD